MKTEYGKVEFERAFVDNYYNDPLIFRKFLSKIILHAKGNKIVDLGCGSSLFGRCCKMFGFEYLGADLSEVAERDCRDHGIAFEKHDIAKTLPSGTFDIVVLHGILEHIKEEDGFSLLHRIKTFNKDTIYSFQIPTREDKGKNHEFDGGGEQHITVRPYSFWKKAFRDYNYYVIDEYNWSWGRWYPVAKITKWSPLISQINAICKL